MTKACGGGLKKRYQLTAIDDWTRIRVLRIYDLLNQQGAIRLPEVVADAADEIARLHDLAAAREQMVPDRSRHAPFASSASWNFDCAECIRRVLRPSGEPEPFGELLVDLEVNRAERAAIGLANAC